MTGKGTALGTARNSKREQMLGDSQDCKSTARSSFAVCLVVLGPGIRHDFKWALLVNGVLAGTSAVLPTQHERQKAAQHHSMNSNLVNNAATSKLYMLTHKLLRCQL